MLVSAVLLNGLILDIAEPLSSSSLLLLCLVISGLCFSESLLNSFLCYKPLLPGVSSSNLAVFWVCFYFILQALIACMLSHSQAVITTAHRISLSKTGLWITIFSHSYLASSGYVLVTKDALEHPLAVRVCITHSV